jgi:pyrimidine deaminase RibD-like protein
MDFHRQCMARAIELSEHCTAEPGREEPAHKVGVVIASNGEILEEAYRGQTKDGDHAEYTALERLQNVDLTGAVVYTTLEPCTSRNPPKIPCADRLIERGIDTVYIGSYDPDPRIYKKGWRLLLDAGMTVKDFPADLRNDIAAGNAGFLESFRSSTKDEGEVRFDFTQNGGRFTIDTSTAGEFETHWSGRSANAVYAYSSRTTKVAEARYAHEFSEIDDPSAYDFEHHSVAANEGDVVLFQNDRAFLLVKITSVLGGPERAADRHELRFAFRVRPGP